MTQHDLSPEEKLLRLIKNQGKKETEPEQKKDSAKESPGSTAITASDKAIPAQIALKIKTRFKVPGFKAMHYLLWIIFIISFAYLVIDSLFIRPNLEVPVSATAIQKTGPEITNT